MTVKLSALRLQATTPSPTTSPTTSKVPSTNDATTADLLGKLQTAAGQQLLGQLVEQTLPPTLAVALDDISAVAHGGQHRLFVDRVERAGKGCSGFVLEGTGPGSPLERAASGDYDVVVLLPSIGEGNRAANEGCWEQFRTVVEASGVRFGMMATFYVSNVYRDGGDVALDTAIRSYSADHDLLFVPAGATWRRHLGDQPTDAALLALYHGDLQHPGPEGSYLSVLALYGALTGRSVQNAGIDNDIAALRCDPRTPCLTEDQMRACLNARGEWQCAAGNGTVFSNGQVHFVFDDEAVHYQSVVDEVLAQR